LAAPVKYLVRISKQILIGTAHGYVVTEFFRKEVLGYVGEAFGGGNAFDGGNVQRAVTRVYYLLMWQKKIDLASNCAEKWLILGKSQIKKNPRLLRAHRAHPKLTNTGTSSPAPYLCSVRACCKHLPLPVHPTSPKHVANALGSDAAVLADDHCDVLRRGDVVPKIDHRRVGHVSPAGQRAQGGEGGRVGSVDEQIGFR